MSQPIERFFPKARRGQIGASLIELIMFIVVVGAGLAGILGVWNITAQGSADPLIQKQALAIAEAYLEETLAAPFTYCDPDDANAATAQSTGAVNPLDPLVCAATLEGIGAEGGETRAGTPPFDNVSDYSALAAAAPADIEGNAIAGLGSYNVSATVIAEALDSVAANDSNSRPQSLRVSVTVTGPGNITVRLDGYRTRYAPNALP